MSDQITERTVLFRIRDAARTCPDRSLQLRLKDIADELKAALKALADSPIDTNLQLLNGLWVRAWRLLELVKVLPDPSGGGSLREEARLAA
jgi:hypothetical protein